MKRIVLYPVAANPFHRGHGAALLGALAHLDCDAAVVTTNAYSQVKGAAIASHHFRRQTIEWSLRDASFSHINTHVMGICDRREEDGRIISAGKEIYDWLQQKDHEVFFVVGADYMNDMALFYGRYPKGLLVAFAGKTVIPPDFKMPCGWDCITTPAFARATEIRDYLMQRPPAAISEDDPYLKSVLYPGVPGLIKDFGAYRKGRLDLNCVAPGFKTAADQFKLAC